MPPTEADKKRNLVRWDDDKDKQLLLCLQYVCANAGIRIPWEDVAQQMGPKFSGGACVQHLAKLRSRMEEENIPVPPPLARGLVTSKPSSVYAKTTPRKRQAAESRAAAVIQPLNPPSSTPPPKKRKYIKKEPGIIKEEETEGDEMPVLHDNDDTDDDYGDKPKKKARTTRGKGKKATKKTARRASGDEDLASDNSNPQPSPRIQTRRNNRVDYSNMDRPVIEDDAVTETAPEDEAGEAAGAPEQHEDVKAELPSADPLVLGGIHTPEADDLDDNDIEGAQPMLQTPMQAPGAYFQDFSGYNPNFSFSASNNTTQSPWGPAPPQYMYGQMPQPNQYMYGPSGDSQNNTTPQGYFPAGADDLSAAFTTPTSHGSTRTNNSTSSSFAVPSKKMKSMASDVMISGNGVVTPADLSRQSSLRSDLSLASQETLQGLVGQTGMFGMGDYFGDAEGDGGMMDWDDAWNKSLRARNGGGGGADR